MKYLPLIATCIVIHLFGFGIIHAQKLEKENCFAILENDTLRLGNQMIERIYAWQDGDLRSLSLEDKGNSKIWEFKSGIADLRLPGNSFVGIGKITMDWEDGDLAGNACMKVSVISAYGSINVKRIFKIYPDCPAIACDVYLIGNYSEEWTKYDRKYRVTTPVFETISPVGVNWRAQNVEFFDRTDDNNTLVREHSAPVFIRQTRLKGNLLFLIPEFGEHAIFTLKESPSAASQFGYPGCDFILNQDQGHFLNASVAGLNLNPGELNEDEWIRCSGFVTGVSAKDTRSMLGALRSYQDKNRKRVPERDEMILMNTWGDRSQDSRMNENFILDELVAANKLGITHLQLDDGWQTGRTKNSAYSGGSLEGIWTKGNYWEVHPERFPEGLDPIVEKGRELGVEIGLWFNPSTDSSYKHWREDASVLIGLHRKYGINTFKIDGVEIPDKQAEINFRAMLDSILYASGNKININLDVTGLAMRPGYHFMNEYGNIFLENRYTDWINYHPHWTLRNLWMLSAYVPAQNLQIEFLNPWRNQDKYLDTDPLAPSAIPFLYQAAVTLMAQPLAWFEGSNLPREGDPLANLMVSYKAVMQDLHSGKIFPIGDEPDGKSWTGFISEVSDIHGYMMVYRELNSSDTAILETGLKSGKKLNLTPVLGAGEPFRAITEKNGSVSFNLPGKWSYALYKYEIVNN